MLLIPARFFSAMAISPATMSRAPSEQSGRADQQYDRHDDEDHRVRRLRKEYLGQSLDDAETEAGHDGAEYRAHAAAHHHGEHDDDQPAPHPRPAAADPLLHHPTQFFAHPAQARYLQ